ncbi:MAG: hypothetical protein R2862_11355 [Thermoanaerobaculia bacterium]
MAASSWFVAIVVAVVVWIVLEGRRQNGSAGRSRRRGLMRTGLLELQKQLELERRIEIRRRAGRQRSRAKRPRRPTRTAALESPRDDPL